MRPRFSLKWLLIAVTVLSVALFVLVIYPTNKARIFVAGINDGTIAPNDVLISAKFARLNDELPGTKTVVAELLPSTWVDLFAIRRRVQVVETSASPGITINGAPTNYEQTGQIGVSLTGYWLHKAEQILVVSRTDNRTKWSYSALVETPLRAGHVNLHVKP